MTDPRRRVPRTDVLLADSRLAEAERVLGRGFVKTVVAQAQQRARAGEIEPEQVVDAAVAALPTSAASLRPVINATGVVVHTNLGRAPLSQAAVDAVVTASGATDVEFDLETGRRARRGRGALAALARAVPTAGGVHVVNNNAAALLLTAMTLAPGKEIVISRGELIEIGDGFRLPELMESTGSRIREVGTTNRTHFARLRRRDRPGHRLRAQGPPVELPRHRLHVGGPGRRAGEARRPAGGRHRLGPADPAPAAARRARRHDGAARRRRPRHRERRQASRRPAGGPAVRRRRADRTAAPPSRGARPARRQTDACRAGGDCGGSATAGRARRSTPTSTQLRARAQRLVAQLPDARAVDCIAAVGGGGAPGVELPSAAVSLPESYAASLRTGTPAVVGRLEDGRCLLDLRTVAPDDDELLVQRGAGMYVVATAGHVDHGKSTLVQRLTGMWPDRLAEEQRRGLTIDLGFAWTEIDGRQFAFVDVPGHERFVANMLAGVGPVPAVMFVVAATEGWMPQSDEHLAALARAGRAARARGDQQGRPGRSAAAIDQVRQRFSSTSLADPPSCSAPTWTGCARNCWRSSTGCRHRTATPTCGCGSTAPSPSAARAPSSPARWPRAPSGSATNSNTPGAASPSAGCSRSRGTSRTWARSRASR